MSEKPIRRPGRTPVIPSPSTALLALFARRRALRLAVVVAAVALAWSLLIPAFATRANLVTMLADASVMGIAAIGLLLVVLSGGIDLSIGAVAALAPSLGSLWAGHPAAPLLLLLALAAGAGIGLVSGLLIVGGGLAAFAVTLAVDAIARSGAAALATAPGRAGASVDLFPSLDATLLGLPVSVALLAVIAGAVGVFLTTLRGGRVLVAIGSDREAARAAGLDVFTAGLAPYVASGVLAGIAGLLSATAAPSSLAITELGGTLTLDALAAVVVGGASLRGGRGSVPGTLLGVALVVVVRSGLWLLDVGPLWQGSAVGALLLSGLVAERLSSPPPDAREGP